MSQIRTSNLHFVVQESPFSIYLTFRKKFLQNPQAFTPTFESHENSLSDLVYVNEFTEELKQFIETIKIYKTKLEESEAQFIKISNKFKLKKEELVDEIKLLNESIKKANIEESI